MRLCAHYLERLLCRSVAVQFYDCCTLVVFQLLCCFVSAGNCWRIQSYCNARCQTAESSDAWCRVSSCASSIATKTCSRFLLIPACLHEFFYDQLFDQPHFTVSCLVILLSFCNNDNSDNILISVSAKRHHGLGFWYHLMFSLVSLTLLWNHIVSKM